MCALVTGIRPVTDLCAAAAQQRGHSGLARTAWVIGLLHLAACAEGAPIAETEIVRLSPDRPAEERDAAADGSVPAPELEPETPDPPMDSGAVNESPAPAVIAPETSLASADAGADADAG